MAQATARDRRLIGVILAGGLSRRMGGGDKCLRPLAGRPLLAHVLERLTGQIGARLDALVLNANGDPARFAAFDLPVAPDGVEGFAGPLAGVLAGLDAAADRGADAIITVAADTPFFPRDLTARLLAAAEADGAPLACAETEGRDHPTFGLWPTALAEDLRRALVEEELRKVVRWTERHGCARAPFPPERLPTGRVVDPFFNVNTPDDMAAASDLLRSAP